MKYLIYEVLMDDTVKTFHFISTPLSIYCEQHVVVPDERIVKAEKQRQHTLLVISNCYQNVTHLTRQVDDAHTFHNNEHNNGKYLTLFSFVYTHEADDDDAYDNYKHGGCRVFFC